MARKELGKQSVLFEHPPIICGAGSVVGQKESEGPYGSFFDEVVEDPKVEADSWEEAEGKLQTKAAELAIDHVGIKKDSIRYLVAGDLLGQLMATSFGLMNLEIPLFGVYGACSTMGESISLASVLVDGGFADYVLAVTSSHFASAEKQFRFPLGYGNQRPRAATWTVTGSGAVVIRSAEGSMGKGSNEQTESGTLAQERGNDNTQKRKDSLEILVKGITTGKVVDLGIKDSMNMGACMAPAAGEVIYQNFMDFDRKPEDYDRIITGDLGMVGKDILLDYLRTKGFDMEEQYMDCGIEIFSEDQNTQAGGSGCGCSAVMLAGYILKMLNSGEWQRVLFVPTGALLSQVSFNEGNSVPGIAHGVVLESGKQFHEKA